MQYRVLTSLIATILSVAVSTTAVAWNALGHRVVAEIAWQQIAPEKRQEVVDTLKRHPRFAEDFLAKMPADIAKADQDRQDRWIFWQAAVWPDIARGGPFDRPTWHYINFPTFIDGNRVPVGAQLETNYPGSTPIDRLNCIQAVKYAQEVLQDRKAGPDAKALAYCWLFHLVGDMHQPLHSTALFSEQYPRGDKGGNDIPLVQGRNLHSLWDNLLGRNDRYQDVMRESEQLKANRKLWEVEKDAKPETWITEGQELAQNFAYDAAIIDAVRATPPGSDVPPVTLSEEYLKAAGAHARRRVVAGGVRLGAALHSP
jgi:hypothetical protein